MGVLFFILKLIGKILLILLLLILIIILLVLFVPFRYRIAIDKEGSGGGGTATVSWLLRMIQVTVGADIRSETGFRLIKDVKIFGVSLFALLGKMKGGKKPAGDAASGPAPSAAETASAAESFEAASEPGEEAGESGAEETGGEEPSESAPAEEEETDGEAEPESGEGTSEEAPEEAAESAHEEPEIRPEPRDVIKVLGEKAISFIKSIPERILNFTLVNSYRIMETLVRLLLMAGTVIWKIFSIIFRLFGLAGQLETIRAAVFDKIFGIIRLVQKWVGFATDVRVHEAVAFLTDRVKKILGHVLPRKLSGRLEVGFDDPSLTGNMMAVYAAVYPLYLNDFELTPYFNETRFEGKADIRGRIYLFYLAYLAVTTILNKNIRYVISYLKYMKEEDS